MVLIIAEMLERPGFEVYLSTGSILWTLSLGFLKGIIFISINVNIFSILLKQSHFFK